MSTAQIAAQPAAFVRAAALLAGVTALLDVVSLAALHVLQPGVDAVTAPTSSYVHGRGGAVSQVATLAVGIGGLSLATALSPLRAHGRGVAGLGLLAIFGVAKVIQAFFPLDSEGVSTTTGAVHNLTGNVAFFVLPAAAVLLGGLVSRTSRRRAPIVVAWVLVALTVGVLLGEAVGMFGVMQRVYLVAASAWVAVCALAAWRSAWGPQEVVRGVS